MKGIILAGKSDMRLRPLIKVTSKQLLPIFSKLMIYYPMCVFINASIRDILIFSAYSFVAIAQFADKILYELRIVKYL